MAKSVEISDKTIRSKIVKYKLEEDAVNLRLAGLSFVQIAEELNASGKIPEGDSVSSETVKLFLTKLPQVTKALVRENESRLVNVVNSNLDILHEVSALFQRTKILLDEMEERAKSRGENAHTNPYQYKAVASELRETLKLMMDISKDMSDYDNVKKFMQIILGVLREEAPQAIPSIIERLKLAKGTNWFSELLRK